MQAQILAPAAVLVVWSLIMLFWMAGVRLPALKKAGIDLGARPGGRGQDLEGAVEPRINWPAHNYSHLMEQPTVFYAVAIVLALTGTGDGLNATLAWIYVGLRILHSLIQATVNRVIIRFALFALSSLVLMALILHAAIAVF